MAYEQLAKPGTVTGNAIVEGAISSDGTAASKIFFIKPTAVVIQSQVEVVDVTGDIDTKRVFENGRLAATQFQVQGYMVADSAISLSGLSSENNNGNSNANCELNFYPHSGRKVGGTVVFSQIDMQWARNSPYVAVNISGYFTDVDFTNSSEES
tara:strand:+ start:738 stop:1199 length:462 start_codon:yes stop_codon:yes gene_type:complete